MVKRSERGLAPNLTSVDLFAGAGGLSEGLREAGFGALFANEINETYARTYKLNNPSTRVQSADIRSLSSVTIRHELKLDRGELDLLAGGPPCQGFSINAPLRSKLDQRNHLFKNFLGFVGEFQPKATLIENVPGLVSFEAGQTLDAILTSLSELGYSADVRILYAPHFGVPQTRWRTIVLGLREDLGRQPSFPNPIHEAPVRVNFTSKFQGRNIVGESTTVSLPEHVTVRQAIADLPPLSNGERGDDKKDYISAPQNDYQRLMRIGSSGVLNHEAPRLSSLNMERLSHIKPGGNWTDIPVHLLPEGMKKARRSDHTMRYGRVDPEGLASTILTKCDPHWGAYFHYEQDRAFTVREAARIQSFPDSYEFIGARVEQYAQVGNAVPPLLAAAIGLEVSTALGTNAGALVRAIS